VSKNSLMLGLCISGFGILLQSYNNCEFVQSLVNYSQKNMSFAFNTLDDFHVGVKSNTSVFVFSKIKIDFVSYGKTHLLVFMHVKF